MTSVDSHAVAHEAPSPADPAKLRLACHGNEPGVLADIYRENVNIAVWQRGLAAGLRETVAGLAASSKSFSTSMTVSPGSARSSVGESLGTAGDCALSRDVAGLVGMFCDLLGLKRVGLRLRVLDAAMCPRFHVDRVPCRLVTTYLGAGTEWVPHEAVDRSKLGPGSRGQSDLESGLLRTPAAIRQLHSGDVALLKGELWEGNEDAGLVHRSPGVAGGEMRLLLTLDVSG